MNLSTKTSKHKGKRYFKSHSTQRSHFANELNEGLVGECVSIAGWIEDIRDIGKLAFVLIRDVTGVVQTVVTGENLASIKDIPRQSTVIAYGVVTKSKAKRFSVELKVDHFVVLSKSLHPLPLDPTGRVEAALDKRLDSRALDLRNPKVSAIFRLRSNLLQIIRTTLHSNKFIEVNTPKIISTASEGGANLFSFKYFNTMAYLAQSPQLYKEQLTLSLDRVFEIGPYFRAEKSHTVRHLAEFTSVDIEAAFLDYKDVMDVAEQVIRNLSNEILHKFEEDLTLAGVDTRNLLSIATAKIERISYKDCVDKLVGEGEKIQFGDDLSDSALRKLGNLQKGFYFIIDWPLKLKPFYIHEKEDDPTLSDSFDLQYGYLELVSGGTRQHDRRKLRQRILEQGLDPLGFSEHLKVFDWGMPPHSGWGLGFDRLMMVLTNSQNIREVVLYPRDTQHMSP